ncbi:MAG: phytoene desaturase family protein [candidate division KSB1 bacterium]|nr:phytoene desaturase family protein [candidate division KSB1 bacterium]MDZ7272649.1 phytoene desaturase family protein [candidate division KSB1 bacterium]MDZ7284329.1 phytoene desaturase family protein [candidate division KSB1 bacterium]MDZ7297275.1 phytoene desaturase family protein [candidate division KSB1 bacterium]MDZ7309048.1 phytoene desaturase family protein [candidate division KSB1 bacterium]
MTSKRKIVVIGSGFGGLAVAIRLQAAGFAVTLLEKNAMVGGHACQLKQQGYTFDMGPSLITAPDIIQAVFASAGRHLEDYLELMPLNPFYRIYYHDGSHLDYSGDGPAMKAQISAFHRRDGANYERFLRDSGAIYHAVITDGLGTTPFHELKTMLAFLPRALRLKALYPAYFLVSRYFRDPRNRFAFSFHPLFIGGNPFRAPSVYLMIPYLEKAGGVWFSRGGMYSLVQAFEKLFLELGGRLQTQAEVTEIFVRNGRATGVLARGEFHSAEAVISNADWAHTHLQLLKPEHRRRWTDHKVRRLDYAMSAFLLYLGVRKQYPRLLHHTLILSPRYRELVKDIFDRKILPEDFSMYLHVPTRTDPGMAPPGCESMYVLIPVPNLAARVDWQMQARPFADKVLRFLEEDFGLSELRRHLEVMQIFTPLDFKLQRNCHLGSAWGVEPKLTQTAYLRPHNRSNDIRNLYFVGASTHPGAGVPGVLLTAAATERLLRRDFGMPALRVTAGTAGL